ncbi:hypothetical protein ACLOJK_031129 [Asimina triloba]
MGTCCFCTFINDVKPRPLDHRDVYQQVEIVPRKRGTFVAKSVAPDGLPPNFLRRKGWSLYASTPKDFQLGEAHGVDHALRSRLPPFDFPISNNHSTSVVVGKWYVPFMFVKEDGISLKDQVKQSVYYEMCLEQLWEEIHACENHAGVEGKAVAVSRTVRRERATVFGEEAVTNAVDGVMWLRGGVNSRGVGLGAVVVDRMKWEAGIGGWIDGRERVVKVERVDECGEVNGWRKFGSYMLVERFVLERLDGSVVLTYDFKHFNMIRSKWEC